MKNFLAASLIAADFWNLDKEIRELKKTRTKWIHYDIMDGHFVPNITVGSCELDSLVKKSNADAQIFSDFRHGIFNALSINSLTKAIN